jgi:coproporphyrinogen III oxidase
MASPAFDKEAESMLFPRAEAWFFELRGQICAAFEALEDELTGTMHHDMQPGRFERKLWDHTESDSLHEGGGEISIMRGRVFEKVGVNISSVSGIFPASFAAEIRGAAESGGKFRACGISVVAHMRSPLVPAVHMNTRMIVTSEGWFGGGADLTPCIPNEGDINDFHSALEKCCAPYPQASYAEYKAWCDKYFYLPHRGEARGAGGIFFDHLQSGNPESDFSFTRDTGRTFLEIYPAIIRRHMNKSWTAQQREALLVKRGRYAEFNLLYDRGTQFGLQTGGNTEAILMSLPPEAKWP